jgi:hypothetical protein
MNLQEAKVLITALEGDLPARDFVVMHTFERDGRKLCLALTERLKKSCRRGRVWKSKAFLTAIKNAQYGFDESHAHSPGGSDGIFVLTRDHRPQNQMMKKVFDRFLDRPDSGIQKIADALHCKPEALIPVRLVSHHLRLLGVMRRTEDHDTLVLVDYDDTK